LRVGRREPQRFGVIGDGAVVLAAIVEDIAAIIERLGVVGIEPHSLVGVGERLVEPADAAAGVRALAEGPRIARIERDGTVEISERKLDLVDGPIGRAAVDQRCGQRLRLIFQRVDKCATGGDALRR
jgi:hypothetical protein